MSSEKETFALGQRIGLFLTGGEVIALTGELGSGKTSLVRGMAAGADVAPATVSSPTFTFIHEYQGRLSLIHVDLYRLERVEDLSTIGLHDYFDGQRVVVIEWAERAGSQLPEDSLSIVLEYGPGHTRTATLQAHGSQSSHLLDKVYSQKA